MDDSRRDKRFPDENHVMLVGAADVDDTDICAKEGVPKPVSMRRVRKEIRNRAAAWKTGHLDPLENLVRVGVPSENLRLYGRWWQLERWLRDVVRLEIMAKYGSDWHRRLKNSLTSQAKDASKNNYMPSPDDANPLAFADLEELRQLIEEHWDIVDYALVPKTRWNGLLDTLMSVRNRIGHARRPEENDLLRIEAALRDLDLGARRCLQAYQNYEFVAVGEPSQVVNEWQRGSGSEKHLIKHALDHYKTSFKLWRSRRPWADQSIQIGPGILWHATWHTGERIPRPDDLWEILGHYDDIDALIHLDIYAVRTYSVVLPSLDDAAAAAAISHAFEAVIHAQSPGFRDDLDRWDELFGGLDYRVRIDDLFAKACDLARSDDIFNVKRRTHR